MKAACLILAVGKRYEKMGLCAKNSFKKFHPDVDLFYITEENIDDYDCSDSFEWCGFGMGKYLLAREIMSGHSYDKIICLGADTITCSRLDEFLDNNEDDVICTLDYCIQFNYHEDRKKSLDTCENDEYVISPVVFYDKSSMQLQMDFLPIFNQERYEKYFAVGDDRFYAKDTAYLNADVVCFNNIEFLEDLIKLYAYMRSDLSRESDKKWIKYYHEQGMLNLMIWGQELINKKGGCVVIDMMRSIQNKIYNVSLPEFPFFLSKVAYNVRSKSLTGLHPNDNGTADRKKFWGQSLDKFYVNDNKLYCKHRPGTPDKQIKVWHYCQMFGETSSDEVADEVNKWIFEYFNEDTRKFFTEQCDCGDFFQKEFKI